jgi:LEA14-like dessication related protein
MKIKKNYNLIGFILFLFIACSCAIHPLKFGKVENVNISKSGKSALKADIMLPIENPNFFKLKVKNVSFHVMLNNVELAKLKLDNDLILPAHSQDTYDFPFELDYSGKVTSLLSGASILKEGQADLKIEGSLKGGIWFFSKTFSIKEESKVHLSK